MAIIKLYGDKGDKEDEEEILIEEEGQESLVESQWKSWYRQFISFLLVRLFIVMIFILCLCVIAYLTFKMLAVIALNVLSLFQVQGLREFIPSVWLRMKIFFVGLIGLLVALFSPSLGITLITAYCMMHFDGENSSYILRFLETRLKEFEED